MICARNLHYRLKRKSLIQDVSFELQDGEVLGLIGPNGSGKSTLLRVLSGIFQLTAGQVLLQGRCITQWPRHKIAQQMAFVEQQAETHERIRVRDAVELGRTPWLSLLNPWSAQDDAIVGQAMDALNVGHLSQRMWHSLSGGERQRVHLARALAQQPQLLLLDEPTNHLDIQNQLTILRLVDELPVSIIIALHDLNQAMRCDRLLLMREGHVFALGPPAQVLNPDSIRAVFGVNTRLLHDPDSATPTLVFTD